MQSFVIAHEWRFDEDEYAQIDVVCAQERRSGRELLEGHALVESRQNIRVNSFEPHRYFEPAPQAIAESQALISDESGMAFDNEAFEHIGLASDGGVILN